MAPYNDLATVLARCRLKKLKILPNPKTESNPGQAKGVWSHNTAARMDSYSEKESKYVAFVALWC
jgi:hypothetical protein